MRHLMTAALALALMTGTSAMAQPNDKNEHKGGQGGGQGGGHAAAQVTGQGGGRPAAGGGGGQTGGYHGPTGGGTANHANVVPGGGGSTYRGGAYGGAQGSATGGHSYQGTQGGQAGVHSYQGGQGGTHNAYQSGQAGTHNAYQGSQAGAHNYQGGQGQARGGHALAGVAGTYNPHGGAPGFRPGGSRPQYSTQFFPHVMRPERQYAWRGGEWRGPPGYYYRHWRYGDHLPFGWFAEQWFIDDYYDYDLPVPPYGYEWIRVGPDALLVDIASGLVVESEYGVFY